VINLNEFYWKLDELAHRFPPYNIVVKYRIHCSLLYVLFVYPMCAGQIKDFKTAAPFMAFVLWHFALYVYNRYTDRGEDALNSVVEAMDDFHGKIALFLTGISLIGGLGLLVYGGYSVIYYLLSLPCVFLYGQPLLGGKLRIKSITFVKNIYAVLFCWALPFVLTSVTYAGSLDVLRQSPPWGGIVAMFFGIMAYEMVWDLRDVEGDRQSGVMTVPVRFGEDVCKLFIAVLLLGAYILNVLPVSLILFIGFFTIIIREKCAPIVTHVMMMSQMLLLNMSTIKSLL